MYLPKRVAAAALTVAVAVSQATPGYAQDLGNGQSSPGISFELGVGGRMAPSHFGSSNLILSPMPLFRLKRLELPNGFTIGGGSDEGFSLSPALGVIGERSTKNSPELAGLNSIDTAIELGVAAKYQVGQFRFMGEIRRGFGGHQGFRGELGADVIVKPDDQWTFHGGPRLGFADDNFTNTYFGVSAAEASPTFPATNASGGLISAGLEAGLRYQANDNWAIEAGASWSRLLGDAASSPITAQGSKNQYGLSLGIVRRFDIPF